jgi:hypothetical protein
VALAREDAEHVFGVVVHGAPFRSLIQWGPRPSMRSGSIWAANGDQTAA